MADVGFGVGDEFLGGAVGGTVEAEGAGGDGSRGVGGEEFGVGEQDFFDFGLEDRIEVAVVEGGLGEGFPGGIGVGAEGADDLIEGCGGGAAFGMAAVGGEHIRLEDGAEVLAGAGVEIKGPGGGGFGLEAAHEEGFAGVALGEGGFVRGEGEGGEGLAGAGGSVRGEFDGFLEKNAGLVGVTGLEKDVGEFGEADGGARWTGGDFNGALGGEFVRGEGEGFVEGLLGVFEFGEEFVGGGDRVFGAEGAEEGTDLAGGGGEEEVEVGSLAGEVGGGGVGGGGFVVAGEGGLGLADEEEDFRAAAGVAGGGGEGVEGGEAGGVIARMNEMDGTA